LTSWKQFEKEVAKYFGGMRRVRINYAESIGDIVHPRYSIECKYGKQVPRYMCVTKPTLLNKRWVLYPSGWPDVSLQFESLARKECKFLELGMNQAKRYDPTKEPILCVKGKGMHGFVICEEA